MKLSLFFFLVVSAARADTFIESSPVVVKKTLKIGLVLPLSGSFAGIGERIQLAVKTALELPKDEFSLVILDSQGTTAGLAEKLEGWIKQNSIDVIIGDVLLNTAPVVARKSQELNIPVILLARKEDLTAIGGNVFRVGLTNRQQVKGLVARAIQKSNAKNFAVLFPKNPLGEEMAERYVEEVKKQGGKVVFREGYAPDRTTFTEIAVKLAKHSEINALFIPEFPKTLRYIFPALAAEHVFAKPVQLLGSASWHADNWVENLGKSLEGAIIVDGFDGAEDNASLKKLTTAFVGAGFTAPTLLELQAYDTGLLVKSLSASTKSVRQTLVESKNFDDSRDFMQKLYWFTVENGKIVPQV